MTPDELNALGVGKLPGLIGVEIVAVQTGRVVSRLALRPEHHAPNGYLHAGTVVTLADTSCGYGCLNALPDGATGFTTIELKSNHVSSLREGALRCEAVMAHGGRTTQVWDATVTDERTSRVVALFRCTQLVLRD